MRRVATGKSLWVPIFGLILAVPVLWVITRNSDLHVEDTPTVPAEVAVATVAGDTLWRGDVLDRMHHHPTSSDSSWIGTFNAILLEAVLAHESDPIVLSGAQDAFLAQIARESRVRHWVINRYSALDTVSQRSVRERVEDAMQIRLVDAWAVRDSSTATLIAGLAHSGSPFYRAGAFREKRRQAVFLEDVPLHWGEAAPTIESGLHHIDIGSTVGPVFANGVWWVVRVKAREPLVRASLNRFEAWSPWVEAMLVSPKLHERLRDELADRLADQTVTIHPAGWNLLIDELRAILPERSTRPHLQRTLTSAPPRWAREPLNHGWGPQVESSDLVLIENGERSTLRWTVGDALTRLAVCPDPPARPLLEDSLEVRVRRALLSAAALELLDEHVRLDGNQHGLAAARRDSLRWLRALVARDTIITRAQQIADNAGAPLARILGDDGPAAAPLRAWAVSAGARSGLTFDTIALDSLAIHPPPATLVDPVFPTRPATPPPLPYPWAHTLPWALRW